ncbi:MAG: hypothetical protein FJ147_19605 [Deltaproteobacteria bacterium]|nr:hypothetical protein [Deltaproteobacteria bacterium]
MPTVRKPRRVQPRTDLLLETQNQILEYLRQDVEEWKKAGDRYDRTQRATMQALAAIQQSNERQTQLIQQSSERQMQLIQQSSERQAQLVADATRILTTSTQTLATMLLEVQAITARTLELVRDIHTRGSNGRSTRH